MEIGPLGDVQAASELGLASGLGVAKLVEPDLLERLGPPSSEALLRTRTISDLLAEIGELDPCHQNSPSRCSSSRLSS